MILCTLAADVTADVSPGQRPAGLAGADALHAEGLTGRGVTIAVVGGSAEPPADLLVAEDGRTRLLARLDLAAGGGDRGSGQGIEAAVAGHDALRAMLSSRRDAGARFEGVAPDADLVLAAAPVDGGGRSLDLASAVEWVVANRERLGIRVLHLPPAVLRQPGDVEDSLVPAVVEAWRAGIVVVVAAGNDGPAATPAPPADLPQVITVGAATAGPAGSTVASYSQRGPTPAGYVKPEILGPAGSGETGQVTADDLGVTAPSSGTAVSSAVVAGVVALLLEAHPWLTPDEVKFRLLAGARPLVEPDGRLAPFHRQGAGMVDAQAAAALPVRLAGAGGAGLGMTWSEDSAGRLVWSEEAGHSWFDSIGTDANGSRDELKGYTWSE